MFILYNNFKTEQYLSITAVPAFKCVYQKYEIYHICIELFFRP